jgi:hypothetical protein
VAARGGHGPYPEAARARHSCCRALHPPQELQQHRAAVAELRFCPSGARLYSAGLDGMLVVYDATRLYAPVQYLSAGVRDMRVRRE